MHTAGAVSSQAPVKVGAEVPWLRKADSDTFLAGSGRLVTRIYPQPVNYKTSAGSFAPIDSSLVASGSGWAQKANDLGVLLPGDASGAARVSDAAGGLSFSLVGASGVGSVSGQVESFPSAVAGGGSLAYGSERSGIGWQVQAPSVSQPLQWLVDRADGLTARLAHGAVEFVNGAGKVAWVFEPPTASVPGARAPLPGVLSLSHTPQGTVITVTPKPATAVSPSTAAAARSEFADYVFGSSVAVPVGLANPSPYVWTGSWVPGLWMWPSSVSGDCYVSSDAPGTSYCGGDTAYAGPDDHALVNFDVADNIPSHVQMLESTLVMELSSESATTAENVGVWQAEKPWTSDVTWDTYDGTHSWSTAGGDTTGPELDDQSIGASGDVGGWFYWDVPVPLQGWVDGNPPQVDGFMVAPDAGSSAPNTLGFNVATDEGNEPYLDIYYQPRMGAYPGSFYDTKTLTDGSTVGVNPANGNLEVSSADLDLPGVSGLDLNVGRYYNNLSSDQNSFGLGWSMGPGADTELAIPSDGNGAVDYFDGTGSAQMCTQTLQSSGAEICPPGLNATLTMDMSGSTWDSSTFTLTFASGLVETFTAPAYTLPKIARLSSISDGDGHTISYTYNSSGQLSSITDTHSNTTTITYNSAGYISELEAPGGATSHYYQNSSGQLTTYVSPAGQTTTYSYDTYGNLTELETPDGQELQVAYDAGDTNEVLSVEQLASSTATSGPTTDYTYASGSTCSSESGYNSGWTEGTVTAPNGNETDYCLNDLSGLDATLSAPPSNTALPAVSGTAQDGQTLTATTGSWVGPPSPSSYSYQWQRCNSTGGSCSAITGATSSTYTLTDADVGSTVEAELAATNTNGSNTAASSPTSVIQATDPVNTAAPAITGTATDGATLTASSGTWSGTPPLSYSYQWQDCNSSGGSCSNITGATASTYTLADGDVGDTIVIQVTASNSGLAGGGSTAASSAATAVVGGAPPSSTALPSVSGTSENESTLSVTTGSWNGSPTSYTYQWEDCSSWEARGCTAISGATSSTYTLQSSDHGSYVAVVVTATNAAGSVSATSTVSSLVSSQFTTVDNPDALYLSFDADVWVDVVSSWLPDMEMFLTSPGPTQNVCGGFCYSGAHGDLGSFAGGSTLQTEFYNTFLGYSGNYGPDYQVSPTTWRYSYEGWNIEAFAVPLTTASSLGSPGDNNLENVPQCSVGDPVNCATGNFTQTSTDLSIPGHGDVLDLARTYNSRAASTEGMFGYGWTSSYEMALSFDAYGGVTVHQAGGATATFEPSETGGYTASARVLGSLVQNSDGTYALTERGGNIDKFSSTGQLLSETDRNGYVTTLSYNEAGQLTAVTDPESRTLTFHYGTNNLVSSVSDSTGRSVSYGYDSSGDLTSVTDVNDKTWDYGYTASGSCSTASHLLDTLTNPDSGVTTNCYDSDGRVTSQTDPAGLVTSLAYSGDNMSASGGTTTITGPHGEVTVENYTDGQLTSETKGSGTSAAGTWTYEYGPTQNVTYEQDPDGNVTTATYDSSGNMLSKTNVTLSQTTSYTYNSFDEPVTITDPAGIETAYTYDSDGNVETKTVTGTGSSPTVETTDYTYGDSHAGDITEITAQHTSSTNYVTDYTYDSDGDVTSVTTHPSSGTTDTTDYQYNTLGEKVCETSPNATAASVSCPAIGDPRVADTTTWTYNPDGTIASMIDAHGEETDYSYNAEGDQTQVTLPSGDITKTTYDADQRPSSIVAGYGTSPAATTTYAYDISTGTGSCSSGVSGALYCNTVESPGGQTTVDWMNARDQQIKQTQPASGTTTSNYDANGNLSTQTTAGGTATYGYNAANQPTSITYSDHASGFGVASNVGYEYDSDGNRTQMTDGTGTSTYSYDNLERLASVENGDGLTVGYSYNLANQQTQISYPGTSHDVTIGYDGAGQETSVEDWDGNTTAFGYDNDGNILTEAYPGSITDTSTYDNSDDPLSTSVAPNSSPGSPIASYTYTYKPNGQVASETDTGLPGTSSQSYSYNSIQQLTSASSGSYAYDSGGDPTTIGGTSGYSYNSSQQLTSTPSGAGSISYTYDTLGDRATSTPSGGSATDYAYNQTGELTGYTPPTGSSATYAYNGDGLRMSKTTGGTTYQYAYDTTANAPLILADGTNDYIYGPDETPIEQITSGGTVQYLHHDQLGSTRLITNSSGSSVGTFTYTPTGTLQASTGTATTPLGYAAGYTDPETSFEYLDNRYYNPSTGQFISVDPLVAATQQPYAYAGGDPIDNTDPTGLCGGPLGIGCIAEDAGNFLAGGASALTLGASTSFLQDIGINPDQCSAAYQLGGSFAIPAAILIPGLGELDLGAAAAEEVTAADLTDTTAQGLRDLAAERGYEPFGQQDAEGLYRKFRYPGTKQQALRIDQGHVDPDTGLPYDNPNAAVPHGHGYDFSGAPVRDPETGDPHFPFQ